MRFASLATEIFAGIGKEFSASWIGTNLVQQPAESAFASSNIKGVIGKQFE